MKLFELDLYMMPFCECKDAVPRLLNDIRIYNLSEIDKQFLRSDYKYIDQRFALVLRSLKFDIGEDSGDVFILKWAPGKSHGVVEPKDGLSRVFLYGLEPLVFAGLSDNLKYLFLAKIIREMMLAIAIKEDLDLAKIAEAYEQIVKYGKELEIVGITKKVKDLRLSLSFTVSEAAYLALSVESVSGKNLKKIRILNLEQYEDAFKFCGRLAVRKDFIFVYPRQNIVAKHTLKRYADVVRSNGFIVSDDFNCVQVPLERFGLSLAGQ